MFGVTQKMFLFLNKAQFYLNKIPIEMNCIKKSLTIVSVGNWVLVWFSIEYICVYGNMQSFHNVNKIHLSKAFPSMLQSNMRLIGMLPFFDIYILLYQGIKKNWAN